MTVRPRVLLQTAIARTDDDWHVGRFSLLTKELSRWADVTARDRQPAAGGDDPVVVRLADGMFDEVWLLAVDGGDGLSSAECAAVNAFLRRGGGVLTARDHADMGRWLRAIDGVGAANFFHDPTCREPDPARHVADDNETPSIGFPNYHSGSNGDVQRIEVTADRHPLLASEAGMIELFPAHPHEGAIAAPPGDGRARTIARGTSTITGRKFDLVVAFERDAGIRGRAVVHSSFHHFADYNWDPALGKPSFVTEPPSLAVQRQPRLLDDIRAYVRNCVAWLRPGT